MIIKIPSATKNFCIIVLLTMVGYEILRFVGWTDFANTSTWNSMNTDFWHHWELAVILLISGLTIFKKSSTIKNILYAVGSGQILDEFTYVVFPQETAANFQWQLQHWYWPLGFEFLCFALLCLIVHKIRYGAEKNRKALKAFLTIACISAIAILAYSDLIKFNF